MQPLTDVFQLEVSDYNPELDEQKEAKSCESCKLAFPRKNPK